MKNKTKLNKLKKLYFKCPNKLHTSKLSMGAIALYSYLAKNAEDFNPSVRTVGKALNISDNTAIKYYKELKDRNIIRVVEKGREGVSTKYAFNELSEWTEKEDVGL